MYGWGFGEALDERLEIRLGSSSGYWRKLRS
jgi:hypothetical protein